MNDELLNKIHLGNCLEVMDSIIDIDALWKHWNRILHPNGTIVLTSAQPFTSILVTSNLKMFKYEWIWKKSDSTNFLNAKHQPLRIHESILVFYNKNVYNPQGLKIFDKLVKDLKPITTENYGATKGEQYKQSFTNYPESVLNFDSANNTVHSTQKPVPLFRYLIRTYSNCGDTVLDNCIGSGTSAEAAILEDRNFIGIEMDEDIYSKAVKRIENVKRIKESEIFNERPIQKHAIQSKLI